MLSQPGELGRHHVTTSTFDLFKLGVGPSSSHTMGPMTAAGRFIERLVDKGLVPRTARVQVKLYASLALTGRGHATDRAVALGLLGFEPASLDPDAAEAALLVLSQTKRLPRMDAAFDPGCDIVWAGRERLPQHPNALTFTAFGGGETLLSSRTYFSVGGGFVRDEDE